jgi:hypothetical protein
MLSAFVSRPDVMYGGLTDPLNDSVYGSIWVSVDDLRMLILSGLGTQQGYSMERSSSLGRCTERVYHWLTAFGFDPLTFVRAVRGFPLVFGDYRQFRQQQRLHDDSTRCRFSHPCLSDRYEQSGTASGHYFHQDLLVARRIFENKPERHIDIGSRVDGLVAHVAAFRDIEVWDFRLQHARVPNVRFGCVDLMKPACVPVGVCDSLSCLHVIEHLGLGRYGDPVKLDGHRLGIEALGRILKTGGTLYLSVPIGPERLEFNAHRVFAVANILSAMIGFVPKSFSYVDDDGALHERVSLDADRVRENMGCYYGCGVFEFEKV